MSDVGRDVANKKMNHQRQTIKSSGSIGRNHNNNNNNNKSKSSSSSVSSSDSNDIRDRISLEEDDDCEPDGVRSQPSSPAPNRPTTLKSWPHASPPPPQHQHLPDHLRQRQQVVVVAATAQMPAQVGHNRSPVNRAAPLHKKSSSGGSLGPAGGRWRQKAAPSSSSSSASVASSSPSTSLSASKSVPITREQLLNGPSLKSGEIQVLYSSPDSSTSLDRHLKEEQAKQVAPNLKQSPIAIMSINPTYELQNKPLVLEYPAIVENLRLNNTGFSWEVKIPYQISMTTALYGAHLSSLHRFRLDQFHCHWGATDGEGSEHTVDNRSYSAELHFVHYNMEKYHTFSKAARHPDGLVVLSVFVDAQPDHHNHAELDKILSHLKSVQLKGQHSIIKQAIRIENLLPANRSYWSYQGSLTTPPYLESVTWFILKYPIRCSRAQIDKCRSIKSSISHDRDVFIRTNHRKTQPLNGRSVVQYEEP